MYSFINRLICFFIPALLLLFSFIIEDPFRIIKRYSKQEIDTHIIDSSFDFHAVNNYLDSTRTIHYNSFIFGNSKGNAFNFSDWEKIIKKEGFVPYRFNMPGESIHNIRKKIDLIEKNRDGLENVLIILDDQIIQNYRNEHPYFQGPGYIHHPLVSSLNWPGFYWKYVKLFYSDYFFLRYYSYKITGEITNFNKDYLRIKSVENRKKSKIIEDFNVNEFLLYRQEIESMQSEESGEMLNKNQKKDLQFISESFRKNNTSFKIIIGPELDHSYMNKKNIEYLEIVFGKESVYDYSGNSKYSREALFSDKQHYIDEVGVDILLEVYKKKS